MDTAGIEPFILRKDILRAGDRLGAVADEHVGPSAVRAVDITRNGEHIAPLLQREIGGDERAAAHRRFHDARSAGKAADNAVAAGKVLRLRRIKRRKFADDSPGRSYIVNEQRIGRGIIDVDRRTQHTDAWLAREQRAPGGGAVHAERHAGNNAAAVRSNLLPKAGRHIDPVGARLSRAHDRDRRQLIEKRKIPADV